MSTDKGLRENSVLLEQDARVKRIAVSPWGHGLPAPGSALPRGFWRAGTLVYTGGGLAVLFCWLLWGDFAWSLKERSVGPVVQILLRKFGASDFVASLFLIFLPQGLSMVITPIIGYKSDRHRGRWGRRIPYLMIPTPFAMLAMFGLAFSPMLGGWLHGVMGSSSPGQAELVLILFGVFWTLFELATITANAVFGALVNDVVPRPAIGRFYGLFRALSLIAGMAFNAWLLGMAGDYYMEIFLTLGTLYGIGFTLMCLNVREGTYPDPPAEEEGVSRLAATRSYMRECFSNPYYRWVFAAAVLPGMAFLPINTFNLYYSTSVGMSIDGYGKLMAFYFTISLVLAVPLGWLVDRFHCLPVAIAILALHFAASLYGSIFIHDALTFGIACVTTGVLTGSWYTTSSAMGPTLLPRAKFAQFASAMMIVVSLCCMVFGLAVGKFLDETGHTYRYTYVICCALDVAALLITIIVYRKFKALGGRSRYVAPE